MDSHTLAVLKGKVWGLLEWYLSNPACDLDGNLVDLHQLQGEGVEANFTYTGLIGSCNLNPTFVERINVTNAFAQTRDKGVISESEYYFVKAFLTGKYRKGARQATHHYNQVMHRACAYMVPIVFPKQYALASFVESELVSVK